MVFKILFLCDRQACEACNPDCYHTNDINHAKNFKRMHQFEDKPKTYWEKGPEEFERGWDEK